MLNKMKRHEVNAADSARPCALRDSGCQKAAGRTTTRAWSAPVGGGSKERVGGCRKDEGWAKSRNGAWQANAT